MLSSRAGQKTVVIPPTEASASGYCPSLCPPFFAIAQTDLILTVPRRLGKITAVMAGLRVVEAPREIKTFRISWRGIRDSPMNLPQMVS